MISVNDALKILYDNTPSPKKQQVPLDEGYHHHLATDISAPEPSPRYTNSAMDGYAVRFEDVKDVQKGTSLKIVGESQAGIPFEGTLTTGQAIRISTGAMVADGADTVVRIEDTSEEDSFVHIHKVCKKGQDVRYQGEEFQQGSTLLKKGQLLGTRDLAMLASVGVGQITIFSPPKISLLVTGTELTDTKQGEIKPFQIRDSNSIMLTSAIKDAGASLANAMVVSDDLEKTTQSITSGFDSGADIILCSGGVSVGKHDHVKSAAAAAGFKELFWKIRQKPGKPLFFSRRDNTLLFGLPGNPVSAFMCFINYVRPVIAQLQGAQQQDKTITAKTHEIISNTGSRTNFIRVTIEDKPNEIAQITEIEKQGSHMLSSIVNAHGCIVLEPGQKIDAGDLVEVILF